MLGYGYMPGHTGLGGPPLVRLLARLAGMEVRESAQALPERLSQWLGWADAIALAAALKNGKRAIEQATAGEGASCAEVRAELTRAILEDELLVVRPPSRSRMQARRAVVRNDDPDYVLYRQCYLALQQRMETAIGALRAGLRARLAAGAPEMAKLASVDAVMEQALAEKEYSLFLSVPARLEAYFAHLRQAAQAEDASGDDEQRPAQNARAWLDVFRKDMQRVLLAELDIRMQPAEGLQAALQE